MLTVKDAAGRAAIQVQRQLPDSQLELTDDGHGGTLIKDPPAASPANVTLFGNYIAAGFPCRPPPHARPCSPATKRC